MKIGILGGTGPEGEGLASRLATAGFEVAIGSRSAAKARQKAQELTERLGGPVLGGAENAEIAASCNFVFLTTPFEGAPGVLRACRSVFPQETILVDVTVPLRFTKGIPEVLRLEEGSGSQHLATLLPEQVAIVSAFKSIPAKLMADVDDPLDCDVFVCSDVKDAKRRVIEAISRIKDLRPLDAGPLSMARTDELMCALAIRLNRRYGGQHGRFRVLGLNDAGGEEQHR